MGDYNFMGGGAIMGKTQSYGDFSGKFEFDSSVYETRTSDHLIACLFFYNCSTLLACAI